MPTIRDQILSRLADKPSIPDANGKPTAKLKGKVGGKVEKVLVAANRELSSEVLNSYVRGIAAQNALSEMAPNDAAVFIYKKLMEERVVLSRELVPILKSMFGVGGSLQFSLISRAEKEFNIEESARRAASLSDMGQPQEPAMKKPKSEKPRKSGEMKSSDPEKEMMRKVEKDRIEKLKIIKAFRRKILSKISNDERAMKNAAKQKIPRKLKKKMKANPDTPQASPDERLIIKRLSKPSIKEINLRVYNDFAAELEKKIAHIRSKLEKIDDQDVKRGFETSLIRLSQKLSVMRSGYKPLRAIKDKLRKLNIHISRPMR